MSLHQTIWMALLCVPMLYAAPNAFETEVRPILERHCFACHGPDKQKGKLRLDTLDPTLTAPGAAETWHDVLDNLNLGEMPPEDEAQPSDTERRALITWVTGSLERAARERKGAGAERVIRRLTRYEYQNTMRDLLGIDDEFAIDLPPESASADGFQNNGAALGMSPLQVETYLAAARHALDKAIVTGPQPTVYTNTFTQSSKVRPPAKAPLTNELRPGRHFIGNMRAFPRNGAFRVRVDASGDVPEGHDLPRLQLEIGLRADVRSPTKIVGELDVHAGEAQRYEFTGRIEQFPLPGHNPKFPGSNIILSNVLDDGLPPDVPVKHKTISLTREQKRAVGEAMKVVAFELPDLPDEKRGRARKSYDGHVKAHLKRMEELRVVEADDPAKVDLAFRLYDAQTSLETLRTRVEAFAKERKEDPETLWETFAAANEAILSDHAQVLERFKAITPINRKGDNVPLPPKGPPRSSIEITSVEFIGPVFDTWPPKHHTRLLPAAIDGESERARAERSLRTFIGRAFRRPARDADLAWTLPFFDEIRPTSDSFEDAMRECYAMVLVSPEFLYVYEPVAKEQEDRPLDAFELASRLSYFLWATMPDDTLMALAADGTLAKPEVLEAQVKRMLDDPRSGAFVRHFTDQWLTLSGIDRVAVNPEFHPKFDDALKAMMREESRAFFAEVLRSGESALAFLDADFAMLNAPLAKHYGLSGPLGSTFERVSLPAENPRGGLLTQAGILLLNSDGEQTHPVRRAVWLLDRLLGDPPAPPPPDVPELESDNKEFAKLSLKRQLEVHREKSACNDCHRGIDPWGIPFEAFDAVGLPAKGKPDIASTLPGGHDVNGMGELKAHLLKHERHRFARSLTSKLLAYALGRSLTFEDRTAIDSLTAQFETSGYKLDQLIVSLVQTETFQMR